MTVKNIYAAAQMSWHAAQVGFVITGLVAVAATLALSVRIVTTAARSHRWARRG